MLICLPVMLPQTTILVTGAAGALGRVVFASLQREGYRVRGFDRLCCPWSDPMDWVTGALQSAQDCQRALQGVGIVIHLAAVPDDAPFESDLIPSNILGLYNLLEAAKESGVQRVLMASTGQVVWEPLNHGPWPVRAHAAPSPLSWYALTKVFAEEARGRHRSMSQPFSTRLRERFGSPCLTLPNLLHIKSFPYAISIFTDSFCDLHAVLPA